MNLSDSQKQQVSAWLEQGLKVADVQKKMAAELGVTMTYMEVRFLLDDLRLNPKDPEPPKQPGPESPIAPLTASGPSPLPASPVTGEPVVGGLKLTVDTLARPGTVVRLVSGPDGPDGCRARTAGLQTVAARRDAVPRVVADRTAAVGFLSGGEAPEVSRRIRWRPN